MKKLLTMVLVLSIGFLTNIYKVDAYNVKQSNEKQPIEALNGYTVVCSKNEQSTSTDSDLTVTKEYNIVPSNLIDTCAEDGTLQSKKDLIGTSINVKLTINYTRKTLQNVPHIRLKQYKCEIKMLDNTFAYKNGKHEIYNKGLNVPDADVVRNSYTTTTSSKSFTYIVPSSWKYVDVEQHAIVGGTVTVNITRAGNNYSGRLYLEV